MLTLSVYPHPKGFPADVLALFASGVQGNVENSAAWYSNLIDTVYPGDAGVSFYVLRQDGCPIAALPLRASPSQWGQRVAALSNYYTALYAPLLAPGVTQDELAFLLAGVRDAHAPLASMQFAPMDPEAAHFGLLKAALKSSGLVPLGYFCFGNWYLRVTQDWATYLRERDGKVRSTLQRMGKKWAAGGGTLELVQGGARLELALAAYQQVYAASWKDPEGFADFVPGLIRTCAAQGWLRLGIAWLGSTPVAAQLWIVAHSKANIYKLAHDEHYKAHAAGTLLTGMLMAHVMQHEQVKEVDYLMGDDPYKQLWMSHRRQRWGLMAYNPKNVAGLLGLGREAVARAFKYLTKRPPN
jgi:CelD/BcsL family acetyltransferase involved in cellulose biosynthesis